MAWFRTGGGESLDTQLTAQETLIQTITESLVGKATLANATADKIIEGFCAYVGQQLVQGTAKDPSEFADLLGITGYASMAIDKFTPTSNITIAKYSQYVLSHSLGSTPATIILLSSLARAHGTQYHIAWIITPLVANTSEINVYASSPNVWGVSTSGYGFMNADSTSMKINNSSASPAYLTAGVEYTLITLA